MTEHRWAIISLVVALAGTVGSLYLSLGMGLKACPLCFYQRAFMMAVLAALAIGLRTDRSRADLLLAACWPLAVAGLAVASFHEYLVLAGKLECPNGLLGIGTAPAQSLAIYIGLALALGLGVRTKVASAIGGLVLGLALAFGCIVSTPPMPPVPTKPYDQPLEICRPPFTENKQ